MNKPIALISELVIIDHGKYIVKVSANSKDEILGTALAAADTVEIAEDKARKRVLELINSLGNYTLEKTPISQSPQKSVTTSPPSQKSSVSIDNSPTSKPPMQQPKQEKKQTSTSEKATNIQSNPSDSETEKKVNLDTEITTNIPLELTSNKIDINNQFDSDSNNSNNLNNDKKSEVDQPNSTEENENNLTLPLENILDFDTPITENNIPIEKEDDLTENNVSTEDEINDNIPENLLSFPVNEESSPNQLEFFSDTEETMDFSQIIDETTIEMKRLGWNQEDGRKYLLATYGKKSRHLLSDEELIEFLSYLKTQ